jgi:hypothetical protein
LAAILDGLLPRVLVPRLAVLGREDGSVGDLALGLLLEEADRRRRQRNDAMPGLPVKDEWAESINTRQFLIGRGGGQWLHHADGLAQLQAKDRSQRRRLS